MKEVPRRRWRSLRGKTFRSEFVERSRPLMIVECGDANDAWPAFRKWRDWRYMRGKAGKDTVVDVSVSHDDTFSGDALRHKQMSLTFHEFVDVASRAVDDRRKKRRTSVGGEQDRLRFYLCQCPIYRKEKKDESGRPQIPAFASDIGVPHFLDDRSPEETFQSIHARNRCTSGCDIVQINLWCTGTKCRSTLHYDCNHNLLAVTKGCKTVKLWSPIETKVLGAAALWHASPNHASNRTSSPPTFVARVSSETCLFIPEGWWHQVDSDDETIAANIWFEGYRPRLLSQPHVLPYYARLLFLEMTHRRIGEEILALQSSARSSRDVKEIVSKDTTTQQRVDMLSDTTDEIAFRFIRASSTESLMDTLILLSSRRPDVWAHLLRRMDSSTATILTSAFDRYTDLVGSDAASKTFETMFASSNVRGWARERLLKARSVFFGRMLRMELLGVTGMMTATENSPTSEL